MMECSEVIEILREIYDGVWLEDIPSPCCPEYIEHHEACQRIMRQIKSKIDYVNTQMKK